MAFKQLCVFRLAREARCAKTSTLLVYAAQACGWPPLSSASPILPGGAFLWATRVSIIAAFGRQVNSCQFCGTDNRRAGARLATRSTVWQGRLPEEWRFDAKPVGRGASPVLHRGNKAQMESSRHPVGLLLSCCYVPWICGGPSLNALDLSQVVGDSAGAPLQRRARTWFSTRSARRLLPLCSGYRRRSACRRLRIARW